MEFFGETLPKEVEDMRITKSIYRVPIERISFAGTSDNGFIQGGEKTTTLVDANNDLEALTYLSSLPSFAPNWNNLPQDKRPERPFRFREGKIEKELDCGIRYDSKSGWIFCGPPTTMNTPDKDGENGYFGGCCLEGSDNDDHSFCPYNKNQTQ